MFRPSSSTFLGAHVSNFVPELDEGPLSNVVSELKAFSGGFDGSGGVVAALDVHENVDDPEDPDEEDEGTKREVNILQGSRVRENVRQLISRKEIEVIPQDEVLPKIPDKFVDGVDYAIVFGCMIKSEVNYISIAMASVDLVDIPLVMLKVNVGRLRVPCNKRSRFLKPGQRVSIKVKDEEELFCAGTVVSFCEDLPPLPISLANRPDYDVFVRFSTPREGDENKGKNLNVSLYEQGVVASGLNIIRKVDLELVMDETPFRRASHALAKVDFQTSSLGNRVRSYDKDGIPISANDRNAPQVTESLLNFILGMGPLIKQRYIEINDSNQPYILVGVDSLNATQLGAVNLAMSNYISLIQGPPGTGKLTTAVAIILSTIANKKRVLVTAPSNGAVDNLLRMVIRKAGIEARDKMIRLCSVIADHNIGDDLKVYTLESRANLELQRRAEDDFSFADPEFIKYRRMLQDSQKLDRSDHQKFSRYKARMHRNLLRYKYSVVFTTTNAAGDFRLRGTFFEFVVVDECGQDVETNSIIPIMRLHCSGQVCLLGDHKQLGPVVLSQDAATHGFDKSMFDHLHQLRLKGHNVPSIMLNVQYRMHPEICALVSELFYESALVNVDGMESKRSLTIDPSNREQLRFLSQRKPVVFLGSFGSESRNDLGSSFNDIEATVVEFVLCQLIFTGNVVAHSIGIITSYTAQAEKIVSIVRNIVNDMNAKQFRIRPKIDIATVTGFQGQERDIIVYSLVRSNKRGFIGFLEDFRRLNVAISRARYMLVVIGNPSMFCHSKALPMEPHYRLIELISKSKSIGELSFGKPPSFENFSEFNFNFWWRKHVYVGGTDVVEEINLHGSVAVDVDDFVPTKVASVAPTVSKVAVTMSRSKSVGRFGFERASVSSASSSSGIAALEPFQHVISDRLSRGNMLCMLENQLIVVRCLENAMSLLVDEKLIRVIIGKGGANIASLTQEYSVDIKVQNIRLQVTPFVEVVVRARSRETLMELVTGIVALLRREKDEKRDIDECFHHRSRRMVPQCSFLIDKHRFENWERFEIEFNQAFKFIQRVGVYIEVHIRHDLCGQLLRNRFEFYELMYRMFSVETKVSHDDGKCEFACVHMEISKCSNANQRQIICALREYIRVAVVRAFFPGKPLIFIPNGNMTEADKQSFWNFVQRC